VRVDAEDSDGDVVKVEFFLNGEILGEDLTAPYSYDIQNLAAGRHRIDIITTDDDGAVAECNVRVRVR
jgi:hypothetical protein